MIQLFHKYINRRVDIKIINNIQIISIYKSIRILRIFLHTE